MPRAPQIPANQQSICVSTVSITCEAVSTRVRYIVDESIFGIIFLSCPGGTVFTLPSLSSIISVVEVSTPCAAISARGDTVFVRVVFRLTVDHGMHYDPGDVTSSSPDGDGSANPCQFAISHWVGVPIPRGVESSRETAKGVPGMFDSSCMEGFSVPSVGRYPSGGRTITINPFGTAVPI